MWDYTVRIFNAENFFFVPIDWPPTKWPQSLTNKNCQVSKNTKGTLFKNYPKLSHLNILVDIVKWDFFEWFPYTVIVKTLLVALANKVLILSKGNQNEEKVVKVSKALWKNTSYTIVVSGGKVFRYWTWRGYYYKSVYNNFQVELAFILADDVINRLTKQHEPT